MHPGAEDLDGCHLLWDFHTSHHHAVVDVCDLLLVVGDQVHSLIHLVVDGPTGV